MISTEQIQSIMGGNAVDNSGSKIGSVGQIYLDDQSGQPEWVTVKTGLFGTSETFIPIRDAQVDGKDLKLPYSKDKVKDAPRMSDADEHLDVEQEQTLYEYYGLSYGTTSEPQTGNQQQDTSRSNDERRDRAGEPGIVGQDTSGPTTDEAMTRSEEQLHVGTQKRESGKARLRKYIVTENVSTTVPVSHEEVRVVREPITDQNRDAAMSGGDLTEEEHEVTLHEEVPVVQKETVAVERVKLDTETVTGEQEITEQVRKEQIETDTSDVDTTRRGKSNR